MTMPFFRFCLGGLLAVLSLGVSGTAAIATQRISLTVQADGVGRYGDLLDQTVRVANDAIANALETNSEPVELIVLVNRNGQILPMLMADISPADWQQHPNVENWARYSTSVQTLLGYAQPTRLATRPEPYNHQAFLEREALIDELD